MTDHQHITWASRYVIKPDGTSELAWFKGPADKVDEYFEAKAAGMGGRLATTADLAPRQRMATTEYDPLA